MEIKNPEWTLSILSQLGGISNSSEPNSASYIAFETLNLKPQDTTLSKIVTAVAPAKSITIDQQIDMQKMKSLGGDFLIATFGY